MVLTAPYQGLRKRSFSGHFSNGPNDVGRWQWATFLLLLLTTSIWLLRTNNFARGANVAVVCDSILNHFRWFCIESILVVRLGESFILVYVLVTWPWSTCCRWLVMTPGLLGATWSVIWLSRRLKLSSFPQEARIWTRQLSCCYWWWWWLVTAGLSRCHGRWDVER